jgi:hypothetical protein
MAVVSAYHTTSFQRNLLGNAHYSPQSLKPLLDYEELDEATLNAIGGQEDIFYKEPDLSRGVEGVDYFMRYGVASDDESE